MCPCRVTSICWQRPKGIYEMCSRRQRLHSEDKTEEDFNCSATCEGLHAVVLFDTDPLNKMISRGQLDNALEANNGNSKVFKYASKLIKEYRAFKKNMVRSFNFEPTSLQTHFGALISFNCHSHRRFFILLHLLIFCWF